jgi:hypothetical protein
MTFRVVLTQVETVISMRFNTKLEKKQILGLDKSTFLCGLRVEFGPLKIYFMWPESENK